METYEEWYEIFKDWKPEWIYPEEEIGRKTVVGVGKLRI